MSKGQRVLVGMSGGVDSSVAAALLMEQGYQVGGGTFFVWDENPDAQPEDAQDVRDAKAVCSLLGIEHHVLDLREQFREKVTDRFAEVYRQGATPNPCVVCNRYIKFGAFLERARQLGYDCVATGHYAMVEYSEETGRWRLRRGDSAEKDQSYVLYSLRQEQLACVRMPLGPYRKEQVRAMAERLALPVSHKAESQDICFIPDGRYGAFLERYTGGKAPEGDFVDPEGRVLGRHKGIWHYTIGQRKGLGMGFGKPMYVQSIDAGQGTVTLSDNASLFLRELWAEDPRWIDFDRLEAPLECSAKIRYAATAAPATLYPRPEGGVRVVFQQPQRAVTPGQAVVFYDGEYVVGGATIGKTTG